VAGHTPLVVPRLSLVVKGTNHCSFGVLGGWLFVFTAKTILIMGCRFTQKKGRDNTRVIL